MMQAPLHAAYRKRYLRELKGSDMKEVEIYRDLGKAAIEDIVEFEKLKCITLPTAYKEFISEHNNASTVRDFFDFKNVYAGIVEWSYKIDNGIDGRDISFDGFGGGISQGSQMKLQDFDIYGHEKVISFGSAANGDHICFDYRHDETTDDPHVVLMFHDAYDANSKMLICHVANSFEEFMDSLYQNQG